MTMTLNGSGTITGLSAGGLPDATIQQPDLATGVAGTGPAFSAYTSSSQSFTATVLTKLACNTESYDTNNNYDTSTYRFTPTVAGYYQINIILQATSVNTNLNITVYKNGSSDQRLLSTYPSSYDSASSSYLVYLNGSTDYVEAYASWGATQTAVSKFQAFMARAA